MGTLDFRLLCNSFSNEGLIKNLSVIVAYLEESNVAGCTDGDVRIQCALKLAS